MYTKFNETCNEFIIDLITAFPNIEQFKYLKSGFTMVSNIDSKTPQRIFSKYIEAKGYKDYILSKNEDFFLNHEEFEVHSVRKEYWNEFIDHLRSIWKTMSHENKEAIWKYLKVLVILSDRCDEKN